jgi:hypothetical protein
MTRADRRTIFTRKGFGITCGPIRGLAIAPRRADSTDPTIVKR